MRILEKFLLFLFTLLLAAVGCCGILLCFRPMQETMYVVDQLLNMAYAYRWLVLIGAAVLVLLAVLIFFGVVCARSKHKEGSANVVKLGDDGSNAQISTAAVDCIIQQQKLNFTDVVTLESKLVNAPEGTQVILKVNANANANMQELSTNLQNAVKQQLESMVGLKVAAVKVVIADVTAGNNA